MGDITNGLNLGREGAFFWNMVEKLESFLYIDDTKETFDVVNMLLVGWVVLALLVYVFGNLIANHLQKRRDEASTDQEESADQEAKDHADSEKTVGKVADNDTAKIDSSVPIAAEPDVVKSTTGVLANGAQAIPRVKPLTLDKPVISALSRTDAILRRLSLPTATGTDPECVKWVNNVVHWLYTQEKQHVNPYVDSWLIALNEETQKASAEHGILVEIKRLQDGCSPPQLDDIRTELESNDNLTTLCNVEAEHMVFDVNVTRQLGNAADSTEYEVELEKLTGKLKVTCITEELLLVVRFAEQPTVKLKIKKKFSPEETETPQERALEVVILEIVSQAIGSAAVDLNFTAENDFPPYTKSSSVETLMPIHYDSLLSSATSPARHEQRLLVKVIKATNLGGERGCKEAYCVVEMDEPPQKFQTFPVKDTLSPFWDEHFWFNLQEGPAELLFEIYDKGTEKDTFLGLGIVSIEELLKSPSQRQIIPLQSRPMQNDDVSGSLTVEFLFMEGGVVTTKETTVNAATLEPVSVGKIIEKNQRVTPAGAVITTTTIQRVPVPAETAVSSNNDDPLLVACHPSTACSSSTPPPDDTNNETNSISNNSLSNSSNTTGTRPSLSLSQFTCVSSEQLNVGVTPNSVLSPILSAIGKSSSIKTMNLKKTAAASEPLDYINACSDDKTTKSDRKSMSELTELPNNEIELESEPNVTGEEAPMTKNSIEDKPQANHSPSFVSSASPVVVPVSLSDTTSTANAAVAATSSPVVDTSPALTVSHSSSHIKVSTKPNQEVPGFPLTIQQKPDMTSDQSGAVAKVNDTGDTSESITDTALKEISKSGISSSASKSTLIIHSVQREAVCPPVKENGVEGDSTSTTPPSSPASRPEHLSPADSMSSSTDDQDHARSRSKERKSLMGALKKRFSFSKSRSKSAEQRSTKDDTQSFTGSRSQSMERARSMPASRESSAPRTPGNNLLHVPGSGSKVDSNSTRSSMSELSGCSSSSARTFIHEKSTLVIEINENDVLKHYVIPASVAHKSKWRKRGVKLHIYNGHTFVAKHLSGSITCQVCKKLFPRRPGKQGYACRDCNFMTHKRCHIEVEAHCPKSTINSMEMQYINDPKAKSPAS